MSDIICGDRWVEERTDAEEKIWREGYAYGQEKTREAIVALIEEFRGRDIDENGIIDIGKAEVYSKILACIKR